MIPPFSDTEFPPLPEELADVYEISSCLKYTEKSGTYLLREKSSGSVYLLKTAVPSVYADMLLNEKQILERIHQMGDPIYGSSFPTPVHLSVHSEQTYYIRSYILGQTLEELCEISYKKPVIDPDTALDYVISLTRLLQFMHHMSPPLIHRDIKPQNVVVDPDGGCHFIDLGISQFFQTESLGGINIMGTKMTAPPEQCCYYRTDARSDLYSLGILFYYCLSGEYKVTEAILDELPARFRCIIRKVTRPYPRERYQSADELLRALTDVRR